MPAIPVMEGLEIGDSSGITLGYAATAYVVLPNKKVRYIVVRVIVPSLDAPV